MHVHDLQEEREEEHVDPAGLWAIIQFARKEWPLLVIAFVAALIRGLSWPIFSIIYGDMFKVIAQNNEN